MLIVQKNDALKQRIWFYMDLFKEQFNHFIKIEWPLFKLYKFTVTEASQWFLEFYWNGFSDIFET